MALGQKSVFGDLHHEAASEIGGAEFLAERAHEFRIAGLLGRDIDADRRIGPSIIKQFHRVHDLMKGQVRQVIDEFEVDGKADEFAGRSNYAVLVTQSDQRFNATTSWCNVDFRLKCTANGLSRTARRIAVPAPSCRHGAPLIGIEECGAALRALLHSIMAVSATRLSISEPSPWSGCTLKPIDADVKTSYPSMRKGSLSRCRRLFDENREVVAFANWIQDQQEFVAADSGKGIRWADVTSDSLRNFDKKRIPDGVRVVVVDVLEIVDIDECQREREDGCTLSRCSTCSWMRLRFGRPVKSSN